MRRVIKPHEIWAVYQIPTGSRLTHAIVGKKFALPGKQSSLR